MMDRRDDAPERIYLQVGDEDDATYPKGGANGDEVTWCVDKVFERDVEYVRADIARAAEARLIGDANTSNRLIAERCEELEAETADGSALLDRLGRLLTGVANALKGEPAPLTLHSWHDLPELAAAARERIRTLEAENADMQHDIERLQNSLTAEVNKPESSK